MWIADMESEHYHWQALGTSEAKAREALADGWDRQMKAWGFSVSADIEPSAGPGEGKVTFTGAQALDWYSVHTVKIPTGGAACDGRVIA